MGWGSRTFKGYWTVPPLIVIGGTGASTRLDFTAAQLVSPTVTVEFRSNYGGAGGTRGAAGGVRCGSTACKCGAAT